jgi:hypothetical protein
MYGRQRRGFTAPDLQPGAVGALVSEHGAEVAPINPHATQWAIAAVVYFIGCGIAWRIKAPRDGHPSSPSYSVTVPPASIRQLLETAGELSLTD